MALQERLAALKARKNELETRINEEMKHPSYNEQKVAKLKKQKLSLKEEMQRIQDVV